MDGLEKKLKIGLSSFFKSASVDVVAKAAQQLGTVACVSRMVKNIVIIPTANAVSK